MFENIELLMSVEIYDDSSLFEIGNLVVNGKTQEKMLVLFTFCEVEYSGRTESELDSGDRIVLWKPDGNFQVISDENHKPVNYQPTGSQLSVHYDDETERLVLESVRENPDEVLKVFCSTVYSFVRYDADDTVSLDLWGTEEDMKQALLASPELIEDGFVPIEDEYDVGLGNVDIFGEDASGTKTIIELKRRTAQIKHVDQLHRYVTWYTEVESTHARGILIAPSLSEKAEELIEKRELEFMQIEPLEVVE